MLIMEISLKALFNYTLFLLCTFATVFMCIYWVYRYSLNEDFGVVTYKGFYERENDASPTVSLCLENPFLNQELAKYGVNKSLYLQFLKGEYMSRDMMNVNYQNISIDIADYIKGYHTYFRNGSVLKSDTGLNIQEKRKLTHVSFNGFIGSPRRFKKCFALNIPRTQDLHEFRILISNRIFPNGKRPIYDRFRAIYHISQQFLLYGNNKKWIWPYRAANECYKMRFIITGITIMVSRNKQNYKCIESWDDYDDWVVRNENIKRKCSGPLDKFENLIPMCNTKESIKKTSLDEAIVGNKKLDKPCKTMQVINVHLLENTIPTPKCQQLGEFWFSIELRQATFKEIEQKR